VEFAMVRQCADDGLAEADDLDWKEFLPDGRDPQAAAEFAKDVAAMANIRGGHHLRRVRPARGVQGESAGRRPPGPVRQRHPVPLRFALGVGVVNTDVVEQACLDREALLLQILRTQRIDRPMRMQASAMSEANQPLQNASFDLSGYSLASGSPALPRLRPVTTEAPAGETAMNPESLAKSGRRQSHGARLTRLNAGATARCLRFRLRHVSVALVLHGRYVPGHEP
jgi:hypothetical protein